MILQRCNTRISNYVSCISCKGNQRVVNSIISGESNPKVLVTLIYGVNLFIFNIRIRQVGNIQK